MNGRIAIIKVKEEIENGRKKSEEIRHYECWCEITDLYTNEQYTALQTKLENTIVFTVRKCKKIEEVRHNLKGYCVKYDGNVYSIYATAPAKEETKIRLKCNRNT